jgi:hypothetical protein
MIQEVSRQYVLRAPQSSGSFWTLQEIGFTLQTHKKGRATKALGHRSTVRS